MDADGFLETFFGNGNGLGWGKLPNAWDQWLGPWVDRVRSRLFPIILPRWIDQRMVWYAVAATPAERSELIELITAFVGLSYADFSGRLARLDREDAVDLAVVQYLGESVYEFIVPRSEDMKAVRVALDRLRNLLDARPADTRHLARPTGRVLRDFELALVTGDDLLSAQLIEEVRANGHLNTANIAFLEVARLASLHDWEGVLGHPNLARLIEMRRPVRVTEALVEAIYRRYFLASDEAADPSAATDTMRDVVLPQYGPLYQGATTKDGFGLRSQLLVHLAAEGSRTIGASQLLKLAEHDNAPFTAMLADELMRISGPAGDAAPEPLALARRAVAEGQPQVAMELLSTAEESTERAVLMLQCAYELNTLADANIALAAFQKLDDSVRAGLPPSRQFRDLLAWVQSIAGSPGESLQSPSGWADWFQRVGADPDCHSHAAKWAKLGADEWDPREFEDETAVATVTELLGRGGDEVVTLHRGALPYLLRAMGPLTSPSALPLRRKILDTLLYGSHSRAEREVLLDVLESTIADMDPKEYRQVMGDLASVWSEVQSPATLEWATQALDVLAGQPCPDQEARQAFALAVFGTAKAHQRRVDAPLRLTLDELGRDIGVASNLLTETAAGVEEKHLLEALRDLRVAVYTLTESAGIRARDQLAAWTKAGVEVLTDKVCSDALRVAARESDVFVMVTRSAKHAATDCIREHRPAELPLLITSGKGTSSILYAIRQHLAETAEVAA